MIQETTTERATPSPILDKTTATTLFIGTDPKIKTDRVQVTVCKDACGKTWCLICFVQRKFSKKIADKIGCLKRRYTRTVTLTIDRDRFKDGEEAYYQIKNDEAISQFMHNLSRTENIRITQYVWVLEWHEDGFPHWHLFIETNKKDKASKIGGEKLRKHWKYGKWVKEDYIKNKGHWKQFTEYFENKGYFNPKKREVRENKDKTHQLELPEWAKNKPNKNLKIRKWGSSTNKNPKIQKQETVSNSTENELVNTKSSPLSKIDKVSRRDNKTYGEVLESCGQESILKIRRDNISCHYSRYKIPYKDFIHEFQDMGWYEPREGFIIQFKSNNEYLEFEELYEKYLIATQKDNPAKVPF